MIEEKELIETYRYAELFISQSHPKARTMEPALRPAQARATASPRKPAVGWTFLSELTNAILVDIRVVRIFRCCSIAPGGWKSR